LSAGQVGGYLRQFLTRRFSVKFKRIMTLASRTTWWIFRVKFKGIVILVCRTSWWIPQTVSNKGILG
jgi:hypothetical protein